LNPLSTIYGALSASRNFLYDYGLAHARKLSRPVISVGNISVGGSGKTPFVIALGQLLRERGITFDVLSRGYGRETKGVLSVDLNGSPREFGDEPLLISKQLGCPVVVGESRYEAGVFAEKNNNCEFHLLDDGFQHRSLVRDFEIVLITAEDLRDELLPIGRLREPISALHRTDAIVLTEELDQSQLPRGKRIWRVRRSLKVPRQMSVKNPVAFCGIARPKKFVEQLRAAGVQPAAERFFRDHHRYTAGDIRELLELQKRHGADSFITTQKDVVNLGTQFHQLAPIVVAIAEMELAAPADALDTMLRVIAERRGKA